PISGFRPRAHRFLHVMVLTIVFFMSIRRDLGWVYPKEEFATSAHESWISNHINQFISALNGGNFRHPELGYQRFIDRDLWIDHHILNVMAMNVDALRLSTYFHKARDGKIIAGPVWDFDRSMGSTDGRDDNPRAWNGTGDGTRFFDYPWWERLFDDPDFWQLWIDRWQTQRAIRGELSTSAINARIDFMAQYLSEAGARNTSRWGWSSFPGRVNEMKNWLSSRTSWIDSQFESPPRLGRSSREIEPGFELSINGGTIYYTLDGSDPRAVGGGIAPGAERYTETLVLDDNAKVVARTRSGNDWSGPVSGSYWVTRPRLVITEMMYHPPRPLGDGDFGADDFEFIELLNTGNDPLDLENFEFTGGVELTFGPGATLDPGEYGVVVENRAAFEARYGVGINIVGDYRGNLANGGETVTLMGPLGEPILDFEFDDTWYPDTDGGGLSLVFVDPFIDLDSWGVEENWTESSVLLGTPGTDDDGVGSLGGRQFPGDSNQDGFVDISDALNLLIRLFGGGAGELPCEGAIDEGGNLTLLDVDGDADVGVTDAILLVNWLFRNGDAPVQGTRCIRIEGCPSACGI
ncbi:MAG: CotH kinase family protein, partial [Planctomycetota bacterium]